MDNNQVETDPDLGFRLLERTDFPELRRWLTEPHVTRWWGEPPPDAAGIEEKYGPVIDRTDPTLTFVITLDRLPIGMIQTYRLSDNPEYEAAVGVEDAAGVDLFIGDPGYVGIGLGTEILRVFVERIGWPTYPEVRRYMAGPSIENARSRRAFEKAGFSFVRVADVPDEPEPEYVMVLERPSVPEAPAKLV
jgi:aminoglycoside 6'-N-acetyltransferase